MEGSLIVFIFQCAYILTSVFSDSISKECFCKLPYGSGCDFSTVFDPNNWRKENVALGQRVTISSTLGKYRNTEEREMQGCMAANGNIGNVYISRSNNNIDVNPNCFRTDPSDSAPFWEVDLGKNYSISEVTIHLESTFVGAVVKSPVFITVDDNECIKLTKLTFGLKNEIHCGKSVRGRRVKIQMFKSYGLDVQISICEVQVWGCQSKYFKEDCSKICNEGCINGCDNFNGTCVENCTDGYFSLFCDKLCGACEEKHCHQITGICESNLCQDGWTGKRCDEACAHGYFGANCSSKCPNCPQGSTCNRFNGSCIVGCGDGFTGPDCNEPCKDNTWGPNCSNTCGRCKDGEQCDTLRGHCHSGCEIGWKSPMCSNPCDRKTYGMACQSVCGNCKMKGECHIQYGTCPDGCDEGWTTALCNEGCKPGLYGVNCKGKCGYCAGVPCERFTGVCLTGCEDGWISIFCNKPCAPGTWGKNCNISCGFCESGLCNNRDGKCEKCATGYQGELCNEEFVQASEDYYQIVYKQEVVTTTIVIAGASIVAVIVAVFMIVVRKQLPHSLSDRRQQQTKFGFALPVFFNTTSLARNESEVGSMPTTAVESRNDVPEETLTNDNATKGKSPFDEGVKEHKTEEEKSTKETGYDVDSKECKERKEHIDGMNEPLEVDESSDISISRMRDTSMDDDIISDVDDTSINKISVR